MNNPWVSCAAFFGFLSVALGAFATHALTKTLDPHALEIFKTGVQYQGTHALAILGLGLLGLQKPQLATTPAYRISGWCFSGGIVLFSGSLYALAISQMHSLGIITPIGGVLFLMGWLALAKTAWQ